MNFVLYHAGCCDGYAAAFAAWLTFGPSARYLPVKYQTPVPPLEGATAADPADVFILDFSYPAAELTALAARTDIRSVVVLDHHASAATDLSPDHLPPHPKLTVRFDMARSGAVMAWEFFHPRKPVPELLLLVQDGDLWHWKLPDSPGITAGLWRGTRRKFEEWQRLLDGWDRGTRDELRIAGAAILLSDDQTLCLIERSAVPITGPHGEPGLSVNTPILKNDVAERLLTHLPEIAYVSVWHDGNGLRSFALRSRKGGPCDVSAIAALHGGGGHPSAAGYRCPAPLP